MTMRFLANEKSVRVWRQDDEHPCVIVTEDDITVRGHRIRSSSGSGVMLWALAIYASYIIASQIVGFDPFWFAR